MFQIELKQCFSIKSAFSWRSAPRRIRAINRRPGLGPGLALGQARLTQSVGGFFWDCDPPLGSQNHKIATWPAIFDYLIRGQ